MIEVTEQINAVRRPAGCRTLDAGEARSVIISQVYAAPIDDVCDPPRGFTASWESGGQASCIEVRLASEPPDGTRLTGPWPPTPAQAASSE
jgi:hypothetical protein